MNRNIKCTLTFKTFEFKSNNFLEVPKIISTFISKELQGTQPKEKFGSSFFKITEEDIDLICKLSFLPHEHPYEVRYILTFQEPFNIWSIFKKNKEVTNELMENIHNKIINTQKFHQLRWYNSDTELFVGDETKGFLSPLDIINFNKR